MNSTKTCSKCSETKPLNEFYNKKSSKDGKMSHCKECDHKKCKKYREEHEEEKSEYDKIWYQNHKDEIRQKAGNQSMYENKLCAQYLGIVIAERLVRHLFKDVEMMPNGFPGYDIICNKGKKINVKAGCVTLANKKNPCWIFGINLNKVADFFILVAFDNRTDLNPIHLWMIPGNEINDHKTNISISLSRIHKWDKWKRDINDAQICCAEMKKEK